MILINDKSVEYDLVDRESKRYGKTFEGNEEILKG